MIKVDKLFILLLVLVLLIQMLLYILMQEVNIKN
uniref:Uncharacterized protein n=1 Tax=Candidozyma auris TaxID=498019 RepID=A0A0L0NYS8_CANAR